MGSVGGGRSPAASPKKPRAQAFAAAAWRSARLERGEVIAQPGRRRCVFHGVHTTTRTTRHCPPGAGGRPHAQRTLCAGSFRQVKSGCPAWRPTSAATAAAVSVAAAALPARARARSGAGRRPCSSCRARSPWRSGTPTRPGRRPRTPTRRRWTAAAEQRTVGACSRVAIWCSSDASAMRWCTRSTQYPVAPTASTARMMPVSQHMRPHAPAR